MTKRLIPSFAALALLAGPAMASSTAKPADTTKVHKQSKKEKKNANATAQNDKVKAEKTAKPKK